jgi:hypothetical protein
MWAVSRRSFPARSVCILCVVLALNSHLFRGFKPRASETRFELTGCHAAKRQDPNSVSPMAMLAKQLLPLLRPNAFVWSLDHTHGSRCFRYLVPSMLAARHAIMGQPFVDDRVG